MRKNSLIIVFFLFLLLGCTSGTSVLKLSFQFPGQIGRNWKLFWIIISMNLRN